MSMINLELIPYVYQPDFIPTPIEFGSDQTSINISLLHFKDIIEDLDIEPRLISLAISYYPEYNYQQIVLEGQTLPGAQKQPIIWFDPKESSEKSVLTAIQNLNNSLLNLKALDSLSYAVRKVYHLPCVSCDNCIKYDPHMYSLWSCSLQQKKSPTIVRFEPNYNIKRLFKLTKTDYGYNRVLSCDMYSLRTSPSPFDDEYEDFGNDETVHVCYNCEFQGYMIDFVNAGSEGFSCPRCGSTEELSLINID